MTGRRIIVGVVVGAILLGLRIAADAAGLWSL